MKEEYIQLLSKQNIWWHGRIEDDVHLAQWRAHKRHWVPFQIEEVSSEPFSLNIIVGPRQTGKTTLIKFLIEKLLRQGTKPKNILYARCDEVLEISQLRQLIEAFLEYADSKAVFIFLDEITDVADWEKVI